MAIFSDSLPWILGHEGGWSHDPADPGGATNFGITLAEAERHGVADEDALRAISPEKVAAIYEADYWKFSGLVSQDIATKVFDMCVNLGPHAAIHIVQEAVNAMGADLAEDGHWGPKTEAAVNAAPHGRLMDLLCQELADYYLDIVSRRPESSRFLKGWLRRAGGRP